MTSPAPLTEGNLVRALLSLSVPYAVGSGLNLASMLGDRFWIGALGDEGLAGFGTAHAVWMLAMTLVLGLAGGTLANVAHAVGRGDRRHASRTLGQGLLLALGLGVLGLVLLAPLATALLGWVAPDAATGAAASSYLQVCLGGLVVQAPLLTIVFALQGAGEARTAFWVGAVAPLANLVLDPVLILGSGLALPGAAWATVGAHALALAIGLRVLRRRWSLTLGDLRPEPTALRQILWVGGPKTLEHWVRNLAGLALVAILAQRGGAVIAGHTAALALLLVLIFPGLALGQATAALVGQNLGADRPDRAWRVMWLSSGLYAGVMGLVALISYCLAPSLVGLFVDDAASLEAGVTLWRAWAPSLPFLGVGLVVGKALGGARKPLPALGSAVLAYVVIQLPLVALLASRSGVAGAGAGMAAAFVAQGALCALAGAFFLRPPRASVRLARSMA